MLVLHLPLVMKNIEYVEQFFHHRVLSIITKREELFSFREYSIENTFSINKLEGFDTVEWFN